MKTSLRMAQAMSLCALVLAACTGSSSGAFTPDAAFAAKMKTRAEELARSQMERFQAAEMQYRDHVVFDQNHFHMVDPSGGAYYKGYRNFDGFRVLDIRRTDSLLHPLVVEVEYSYTLMGTPLRHSDFPDSPEKAKADTEYSALLQRVYRRSYHCDARGDCVSSLDELPPRDNVWSPGTVLMDPLVLLRDYSIDGSVTPPS